MPSVRRRTASRDVSQPQTMHVVDSELAKGRFSFIYKDSFQKELAVKQCVPLMGLRDESRSAISALMRDFSVGENGLVGYSAAGGLKVVVKIPEEKLGLVRDYFLSKGESNVEAAEKTFSQGIEWYGVVDGAHVHAALLNLHYCRTDPYLDFRWIVTVIKWHPLDTLKAFGRERNLLQSTRVVEMTLFDTIHALHGIARRKARLSGNSFEDFVKTRGIVKEISDEFCGGSQYSKETTRTLAGAALRIKPEAVEALGKVMNESDMELCKRILDRGAVHSTEGLITDDRAYRHIVSTNTIRRASAFLAAQGVDQSNALIRLKNAFEENGFKCFQAARLNKETQRCVKARHQVSLMNELMGRDSWPQPMTDVQNKLLLSSSFDLELDELDGTGDTILKTLVTAYKAKMPLEAGIRWALYCRGRNIDTAALSTTQRSNSSADSGSDDGGSQTNEPGHSNAPTEAENQESCPLEQLGIKCHNMTLEDYSVTRRPEEEKFHLVLGDPSELHLNGACKKKIDEHVADKAIAILKSLIQPHGWVFFYTRPVDFHMWEKAFKANDFVPLQYAWPMIRNCDTIQANTSFIPQNVTELMIGARKQHSGSSDFQPDISADYDRNVCSRKRKFAVLDCCPEPTIKLKKRNTREPVRKNERSPEPIAEFVKTFCPEQGNVLDAFAGTMETAKACFLTSRRCTALEADRMCYDLSVERLKESASAFLVSSTAVDNTSPNELEGTETNRSDTASSQSADGEDFQVSSENATVCDDCPSTSESDIDAGMSEEEMNDVETNDVVEQAK